MADFEELSFSYLGLLSNAHHDGTTQQIDPVWRQDTDRRCPSRHAGARLYAGRRFGQQLYHRFNTNDVTAAGRKHIPDKGRCKNAEGVGQVV